MFKFNFVKSDTEEILDTENTALKGLECTEIFPEEHSITIIGEQVKITPSLTLYKRHASDITFALLTKSLNDVKITKPESDSTDIDKTEIVKEPESILSDSDLVTGVYEGGLKTWECALDLSQYLALLPLSKTALRVLEVGCGSGLPGLTFLKSDSLSPSTSASDKVLRVQHQVDFQDYVCL